MTYILKIKDSIQFFYFKMLCLIQCVSYHYFVINYEMYLISDLK